MKSHHCFYANRIGKHVPMEQVSFSNKMLQFLNMIFFERASGSHRLSVPQVPFARRLPFSLSAFFFQFRICFEWFSARRLSHRAQRSRGGLRRHLFLFVRTRTCCESDADSLPVFAFYELHTVCFYMFFGATKTNRYFSTPVRCHTIRLVVTCSFFRAHVFRGNPHPG